MREALKIPATFFRIKYNALRYPGNSKVEGLEYGANCQYFAYEFLKYYGVNTNGIENFRSSDLWEDTIFTTKVKRLKTFDLVLFNKTADAFGAHVGVYIGKNSVIHLSKIVGYPVEWDLEEFKRYNQYQVLIGAKRVVLLN